jgi:hypothetical protein
MAWHIQLALGVLGLPFDQVRLKFTATSYRGESPVSGYRDIPYEVR